MTSATSSGSATCQCSLLASTKARTSAVTHPVVSHRRVDDVGRHSVRRELRGCAHRVILLGCLRRSVGNLAWKTLLPTGSGPDDLAPCGTPRNVPGGELGDQQASGDHVGAQVVRDGLGSDLVGSSSDGVRRTGDEAVLLPRARVVDQGSRPARTRPPRNRRSARAWRDRTDRPRLPPLRRPPYGCPRRDRLPYAHGPGRTSEACRAGRRRPLNASTSPAQRRRDWPAGRRLRLRSDSWLAPVTTATRPLSSPVTGQGRL